MCICALEPLKYPHLWPLMGLLSPPPALQAVALPSQISSPPIASILVALATICPTLRMNAQSRMNVHSIPVCMADHTTNIMSDNVCYVIFNFITIRLWIMLHHRCRGSIYVVGMY